MTEPGQQDRAKQLFKALGARDDNIHKLEFGATVGLGLGVIFVAFTTAVAIAHYGFDVPVHDRQTHRLADPVKLVRTIATLIGAGLAMFGAGLWVRRVCGRWYETD